MSEEKKAEKSEASPDKRPVEEVKPAAVEPKAEVLKAAEEPAIVVKKEDKKEPPAPKKEKPSNCAGCNKSIKKKRWYYRSGKFYCSKRCWRTSQKKEEKPESAPVK